MKWDFHPEALEEYREAALYYAERDPALALKFLDAVEDAIRRILESPERYRILDEDVPTLSHPCLPLCGSVYHRTGVYPHCGCHAL